MRDTTILKLAGLVGVGVFGWALLTHTPPPEQPGAGVLGQIADPEELARSLEEHTARVDEDIYDVLTWREMAGMFRRCPDPNEAVRAWTLVAPASLVDERAGGAIARFWTADQFTGGLPPDDRVVALSRSAADELRRFVADSPERVTVLHWRALAWSLTLIGESEEAKHTLGMMRELALSPSSELREEVRLDVIRSMSYALSLLGEHEQSIQGWRLLASMMLERGREYPELGVSWLHLRSRLFAMKEDYLTIAVYPHIIASALRRRDEGRDWQLNWHALISDLHTGWRRGEGRPVRADDPGDPLGRNVALHVCDRVESEITEAMGARGAEMLSLAGWVRSKLDDEAGAQRSWRRAVDLQRKEVERRPDHPIYQYNLACYLALCGEEEEALEALESAVEHGWRDDAHAMRDPDLASLRGIDRFEDLMERARERSHRSPVAPGRIR